MGARRDIGKVLEVVGGLLALYGLVGLIVRLIWDRDLGFVSRLLRDAPWWTLLIAGAVGIAIAAFGDRLKRDTTSPAKESSPPVESGPPTG